jgi:hypothetical protein
MRNCWIAVCFSMNHYNLLVTGPNLVIISRDL